MLNEEQVSVPMVEEKLLSLDGSVLDAEVSAVPFVHEGKHGALVFMRDIKERKCTEEERMQLESQLHQAQKMESIGRLAGGIAHDLNNLLTPILGYSEMLGDQFAGDEQLREDLRVIHQASLSARELIWRLLAFSRTQKITLQTLDLNGVILGFRELLRRSLREDICLACQLYPEPLLIAGNAGQLEQVVMNLAVNAQDAMPSGGSLLIESREVLIQEDRPDVPPGSYALLTVSDTGAGIASEDLAHIFEPFYTTKEPGKGTGLGLSTVYGIVKQHHGSMQVESEPGKKSVFKLFFPLSEECETTGEDAGCSCLLQAGDASVLVVEDNEMVRAYIVKILGNQGYAVHSAACADDALRLFCEQRVQPALVITDIVMPGMNGFELGEKITELQPSVRLLYMSGYARDSFASDQDVRVQSCKILTKPFSSQKLLEAVQDALCKHSNS